MSATTPWWYSGDDAGPVEDEPIVEDTPIGEDESTGGTDWSALIVGAQRVVDWATERVMAPHAEHTDPRENPTCVVCRTMVLLGEVRNDSTDAGGTTAEGRVGGAEPAIQWIPIRGEVQGP